jgi:hypothetical protein
MLHAASTEGVFLHSLISHLHLNLILSEGLELGSIRPRSQDSAGPIERCLTYLDQITGQVYSAVKLDAIISYVYVQIAVSGADAAVAFDNPCIRGSQRNRQRDRISN